MPFEHELMMQIVSLGQPFARSPKQTNSWTCVCQLTAISMTGSYLGRDDEPWHHGEVQDSTAWHYSGLFLWTTGTGPSLTFAGKT